MPDRDVPIPDGNQGTQADDAQDRTKFSKAQAISKPRCGPLIRHSHPRSSRILHVAALMIRREFPDGQEPIT